MIENINEKNIREVHYIEDGEEKTLKIANVIPYANIEAIADFIVNNMTDEQGYHPARFTYLQFAAILEQFTNYGEVYNTTIEDIDGVLNFMYKFVEVKKENSDDVEKMQILSVIKQNIAQWQLVMINNAVNQSVDYLKFDAFKSIKAIAKSLFNIIEKIDSDEGVRLTVEQALESDDMMSVIEQIGKLVKKAE